MTLSPSPLRAFVAFAGGGAKGLVHVGALRALEDEGVEICGVSGTSAGAIVAALCGAGLRGDDLVARDGSRTLFTELAEIDARFQGATALFGPGGWGRISFFRELLQDLDLSRMAGGFLLWLIGGTAFSLASADWTNGALAWVAGSTAVVLALSLWVVIGLAELRQFRDALAELLRRRLGLPRGEVARFEHFAIAGRPSLKIVASDLTGRKMRLFSPQLTPNVAVADAVASSICLPFVFRPWRLDGRRMVDGGLVSNLPAWPFDEERELDLDALTIAFDIRGPAPKRRPNAVTWLGAAVETALSGAGELNTRAVQRGFLFELKSNVDLLAFDMRPQDVLEQVEEATAAARVAIRKRIFTDPEIYRAACVSARLLVRDALAAQPDLFRDGQLRQVRLAVAIPEPGYFLSLRRKYGAGDRRHLDREALLPIDGSVEGAAYRDGAVYLERLPLNNPRWMSNPIHAGLKALTWSRLQWTFCVPIFKAGTSNPVFVVSVNGSGALRNNAAVRAFFSALASTIEDFFNEVVLQLESQD